jgi:uncharacterized membrane protein YdcZ (DUF606 family)
MVRGAVLAVIAGAAIAVQVRLLGRASTDTGPHVVALLVSVAGVAAALAVVAATRDWTSVARASARPAWVAAGVLGIVAIAGLGAAGARAGTVVAVSGSIVGQLVVGAILDRAG